jgi:hypothetical protein
MKRIFMVALVSVCIITVNAQSEKFIAAMQPKVATVDTTRSIAVLTELANSFERIANAEKDQWLPFYYAALCNTNIGYINAQSGNTTVVDALADKANQLITTASTLTKDNSEIHCVNKMIITLRIMVDPMNRYQDLAKASEELELAKKLDANNPRVYLLDGQDKLFTPEQFGGSKTEAKKLFEEALKKFETFKPATSIDPNWGVVQAKYFADLAAK